MKWPELYYGGAIRGSAWVILHDLEFNQSRSGSSAGGVINAAVDKSRQDLLSLGLKGVFCCG